MREIVFQVFSEGPGAVAAEADIPAAGRTIRITAGSLEELHHEARDALIEQLGSAHAAYRVRIRRSQAVPISGPAEHIRLRSAAPTARQSPVRSQRRRRSPAARTSAA